MKREYPDHPIMGVGGVIFHQDAVLLVKRAQEPGKGLWSLPGGVVELGEPLEEALKREIHEEASITVEVFDLVRLLDRIIYDQENRIRFHYVIADFWGRMRSGQVAAASDISEARFVTMEQLKGMGVHEEVEKTILMAIKLRG